MSSSKEFTNKELAMSTAAKQERLKAKKPFDKRVLKPLGIGAAFGLAYVLLRNGPLYRYEWTYAFYGMLAVSVVATISFSRHLGIKRRVIFSTLGFIGTITILSLVLFSFKGDQLDIRSYLAHDATQILHTYNTVDNQWRNDFLDPTGYAYYENVTPDDISKLLVLNSEEMWNSRKTKNVNFESKAQWKPISSSELGFTEQSYKTKISHPDTLCSFGAAALCVNETTGQVLLSFW